MLLGRGAVQMVTQTVNDLFFVVAVRDDATCRFWTLVKGAAIGVAGGVDRCGRAGVGGDQRAADRSNAP